MDMSFIKIIQKDQKEACTLSITLKEAKKQRNEAQRQGAITIQRATVKRN